MKIILFSFIFFGIIFSANAQKEHTFSSENKTESKNLDSIYIIISSTNLSEDMSTLSSSDDEIVILIYSYEDSAITEKALFSKSLVLNKSNLSDTINADALTKSIGKNLILFLLELDSEKTIEQLEPLVINNYKKLIVNYPIKNYSEIEKCIGDDDVLGIKVIPNFQTHTSVEFSDIYRMDRFNYSLDFH